MEEKESIDLLIHALKEESAIMSKTYTENTRIMCETIKRLDRTKTVLTTSIVGIIFLFFLVFLRIRIVSYQIRDQHSKTTSRYKSANKSLSR